MNRWKYLFPRFRREQEKDMREEFAALEVIAGRSELGNLTLAAENARAAWGWAWLEGLWGDLRYGVRTLLRDRSFSLVAVLSLALGIGANTAIFSLMDAVLWRDLPVRDPDRLVVLTNTSHSYFGYSRFAANSSAVMDGIIAVAPALPRQLDPGGTPQRGNVQLVSGNTFQLLGVDAELGRAITPEDDLRSNPVPVVVLSHAYWQRAFGGDPSVLGKTVRIQKAPFTIVGVAPASFFGVTVGEAPDVWAPVTQAPAIFPGPNWLDTKNYNTFTLVGRLKQGVSLAQASTVLTPVSIQVDIERNGPPNNAADRRALFESKVGLEPASKGISFLRERFSKPLHVVFWMVAIGLLLACVNVMSLQFARADERRRELTVRLAIGAGRWRIARQLLAESLLMAAVGGAIGVALRAPMASALARVALGGSEGAGLNLALHPGILLFVAGVSVAAALVSGVLPSLRATRGNMLPNLQQSSRASTAARSRRLLGRTVAAMQMALSLVLVAAACLFAYSLHLLHQFDSGLNRDRLLVLDVDPADSGYQQADMIPLNLRLRDRLAAVPGVESVSFSQNGIYSGRNYNTIFNADGLSSTDPRLHNSAYDHVGPNFFTTAGAHILSGRDFNERDDSAAPHVAIITRAFARRVFEGRNPLGLNLYIATGKDTSDTVQVVGVVQDLRTDVRRSRPMFYLCQLQSGIQAFSTRFLVRTRSATAAVIPSLRAAVQTENSALHVDQLDSADDLFDRTLTTDRLIAMLAWGFGCLALVLAAVGVYGLLSYDVTRRTGEIGIRMAVGARKGDVIALVMKEVGLLCLLGLVAGSAAAWTMARLVEGLVFQIKPGNPLVEASAAAVLALAAIAAAWMPARRAALMDPMAALRNE